MRRDSERQPDDRHVVNLSSKYLSAPQLQTLSRALNFGPSPQFIPKAHIVASVEAAITRAGATKKQATKSRVGVVGALSCVKPPPSNTLPGELREVRQLTCNKDIIVLPADKERATVVMNRSDYSTKMQAMLSDRGTYQPLTKDPTTSLENKINRILMKLRQEGHLSKGTYHQLRSSAGRFPCLYGLPKIHKPGIPLRPIVSFLSSPTYGLSKFLASLLKPVVDLSPHHVMNSQHFAHFIRESGGCRGTGNL